MTELVSVLCISLMLVVQKLSFLHNAPVSYSNGYSAHLENDSVLTFAVLAYKWLFTVVTTLNTILLLYQLQCNFLIASVICVNMI